MPIWRSSQRRSSVRLHRVVAIVALLVGACAFAAPAPTDVAAPEVRQTVPLSTGWRFYFGDVGEAVSERDFDDAAWESVTVPHTWNRLGELSLTRTTATNNKRGTGWYRLKFNAPRATRNQRQFLQFDAVGTVATVWLNGIRIGSHAGAFSRFRFDVTEALRPGATNLLVVSADNSKPAPGSSTQDVIPLAGDFFVHGGLYRGVSLITTDAVHVDMLDYAGPGVYAQTTRITDNSADVAVRVRLRNDGNKASKTSIVTRIVDAEGREVAQAQQQLRVAAKTNAEVNATLAVPNPRLWNGRADPYLYTVRVGLRAGAGQLDAVTQPLGIRSVRVDPNQGFFLNGRHVRLDGVSRHQDRASKGWALSRADHEEDMALIAEVGANAVRFAHYQHAPEWFELADRFGMLVWAEVPFVQEANFTLDEPTPALVANARQQLLEQLRQNYNHPAVFAWSVGNEIDIGNFMSHRRAGKSLGLLRNLHELAKSEDPNRLTTFADCCEAPPMQIPGAEALAGTTYLIGYNRYFGWYYGKPADLGTTLDTLHQRHPALPIGLSEYGAGAALSQHTDNPLGGVVDMLGRPHPEEVQSRYHELSWPQIAARPFVWGSFVWNMFDFSSDLREEGDAIDINDKGLVTYDRKTRKDAFFYYKAQWSNEPVVHIASERYVERPYAVTDVRVYSNAPSVRLKRNDSDLGAGACEAGVCVWREVSLGTGANTFTASADFVGKTVAHSVSWNGPDAGRGMRINSGDVVGYRTPDGQLVGSDNFFADGDAKLLNGLSVGGFGTPPAGKRKTIAAAKDPTVYEGYREGNFSYDIPLPNGTWNVTVHSFESVARLVEVRTFNVLANGRTALKAWSPGQVAGGPFKAAEATFRVAVRDGRLRLQFEPVGGAALVAAITISP